MKKYFIIVLMIVSNFSALAQSNKLMLEPQVGSTYNPVNLIGLYALNIQDRADNLTCDKIEGRTLKFLSEYKFQCVFEGRKNSDQELEHFACRVSEKDFLTLPDAANGNIAKSLYNVYGSKEDCLTQLEATKSHGEE